MAQRLLGGMVNGRYRFRVRPKQQMLRFTELSFAVIKFRRTIQIRPTNETLFVFSRALFVVGMWTCVWRRREHVNDIRGVYALPNVIYRIWSWRAAYREMGRDFSAEIRPDIFRPKTSAEIIGPLSDRESIEA